jgi:hypothetical protein
VGRGLLCRRRSGIESLPQHLRAQPIEPRRGAWTAGGLAHALDRACAALDAAHESGGIYDPTVFTVSSAQATTAASRPSKQAAIPRRRIPRQWGHSAPGDVSGWATPARSVDLQAISPWTWAALRKGGRSITSRSRSAPHGSTLLVDAGGDLRVVGLLMVSHGRSACRSRSRRNATAPLCDCAAVRSRPAVSADAGGSAATGAAIT